MATSKQPETVAEAVQETRLAGLIALRNTLARNIDACDSLRDLAALSGRLQAVLEEIAQLEPPKVEGDGVDEIAQRRATRRSSSTKSSSRSAGTS